MEERAYIVGKILLPGHGNAPLSTNQHEECGLASPLHAECSLLLHIEIKKNRSEFSLSHFLECSCSIMELSEN